MHLTPAQYAAYVAAEELGSVLSKLPSYLDYDTLKKFKRSEEAYRDFIAKNTTNA